jgi:hypothetical protein
MSVNFRAPRRLIAILTCMALVAPVALAGVGSASAATAAKSHTYPSAVRSAFLKNCIKAARAAGVNKKQATEYCTGTLSCIQSKLSLASFISHPSSKTITNCEKKVLKKIEAES